MTPQEIESKERLNKLLSKLEVILNEIDIEYNTLIKIQSESNSIGLKAAKSYKDYYCNIEKVHYLIE